MNERVNQLSVGNPFFNTYVYIMFSVKFYLHFIAMIYNRYRFGEDSIALQFSIAYYISMANHLPFHTFSVVPALVFLFTHRRDVLIE